jgi:predicted Zn-dependent peptidase
MPIYNYITIMSRLTYSIFAIYMMISQTITAQSIMSLAKINPRDPYKVHEYTLKNGLKVMVFVNKQSPRVQTMISVKAGSKYDPAQTTGLAHYLEHMMFKGTHRYGTRDWPTEKSYLDQVSALYEEHLKEQDETKKKAIYARIDSMSHEASKYAVPSEYDKMVGSLGASGTNAFTSNDMTVYVNDIPSNAIDKWAQLESERFSTLVLRLFHTELETVYEEFNRNQDNDIRWSFQAVDSMLMPNHPYGSQTTIGLGEHLKNPSMVNIHKYFDTYYNPNNIAIILCGDVNPDEAVKSIEKHFGSWKNKPIPAFVKLPPVTMTRIQTTEIKGPTKEHVIVGYRFDGDGSKEAMMATMTDMILSNGAAGLIDLNLVQKQKVLVGSSFMNTLKDYSIFRLYAEPKQGQTLEEAKDLMLGQIEAIKQGKFEDWLIPAIVLNLKLQQMQALTSNRAVAYKLMDAFVKDIPWSMRASEIEEMAKITKTDIVKFANEHFKDNYAVCYKRIGEPNRHKVDKPKITPVVLNKDSVSTFKQAFDQVKVGDITPKFLDFNKDITTAKLATGVPLRYVPNVLNKTFNLSYSLHTGTDVDKRLGLAAEYVALLGTDKYSLGALKTEFYKLGLSYSVSASRDRLDFSLSGMEVNLDKGLDLLHEAIRKVSPQKDVYQNLVGDILKRRTNAKLNKDVILTRAMVNYVQYGASNPFTNIMSEAELKGANPEMLTSLISTQMDKPNEVYYYGSRSMADVVAVVNKSLPAGAAPVEAPMVTMYPERSLDKPVVYFCDYNMKQAEVVMMSRGQPFSKDLMPLMNLYNDYYGSGLSSILFQEVREKMGLAYSVNSSYRTPQYKNESHYLNCYVGTQADKLETTMKQMSNLLNNMVEVQKQFDGAKTSVIKNLQSEWITGSDIFNAYDRAQKRGLNYDIRKEIYDKVQGITMTDLHHFFDTQVKGKTFNYLVIGKKDNIDFKVLQSLGEVKELKLDDVFGY